MYSYGVNKSSKHNLEIFVTPSPSAKALSHLMDGKNYLLVKMGRVTKEQKLMLVEFLDLHHEMVIGRFSPQFTKADARKLWEEISDVLNKKPGPKKGWKQWKRVGKVKLTKFKYDFIIFFRLGKILEET